MRVHFYEVAITTFRLSLLIFCSFYSVISTSFSRFRAHKKQLTQCTHTNKLVNDGGKKGNAKMRSDDIKIQNGLPCSSLHTLSLSVARVCVYTCNASMYTSFVFNFFFVASHFLLFLPHFREHTVYYTLCTWYIWICTFCCHFVIYGKALISNKNALIRVNLWTVSILCHIRFGCIEWTNGTSTWCL